MANYTYTDLGNPLFVTISKDEHGKEKIGSVYFEHGRIRLVHPYGPCIELHQEMENKITQLYPDLNDGHLECRRYLNPEDESRLVELYFYVFNNTRKESVLCITHSSRGQYAELKKYQTLSNKLKDIFNLLNDPEYITCQKILDSLLESNNDLSLIQGSAVYKKVNQVSFQIFNMDTKNIFDPTEYGFDKKVK